MAAIDPEKSIPQFVLSRLELPTELAGADALDEVLACPESLTADYLTGRRAVPIPAARRRGTGKKLTLHGATANNLKSVTAAIPLGTFTCVTGVSGSGKSSFTIDTLYAAGARRLDGARIPAGTRRSAGSTISTR